MELDRALEFAVVSSWHELVSTGEPCSVHVEYENVSAVPVSSLEVWMIKNRGYGVLVCRCSDLSPTVSQPLRCSFENSYGSKTLADDLDFIIRNQGQYSRPADRSIHGLVQVGLPSDEDRKSANDWSRSGRVNLPAESGS
jgi:hypothetical protein